MSNYSGTSFFLAHMNFATLTQDSIGPIAPLASGQTQIKALAYNAVTHTWYLISGDDFATASVLYTININTGALTEVGTIQNAAAPITLAIDCNGNAYVVNVLLGASTAAVLYSLNLTTAVATQIGTDLGFPNVTYGGQDMDFNPETGDLYWSAYWSSGFFSEGASFRHIDVANGTSTEITPLGEFDNYVSFSVNAICQIVPVEFSSFSSSVNGTSVTLNWTTATEINNKGFSVERKSYNSSWQEIGFVPGFGTTSQEHSYSFNDNHMNAGSYSYRLKQTDFDGSYNYSDEVTVDISTLAEFRLNQNYPNPFNPSTRINYTIPQQSFVSIRVYSITGEEVTSLVNGIQTAGQHQVVFDAKNLASGVYLVRMNAGSFSSTIKMNLIR
jgi:hypothetical protein